VFRNSCSSIRCSARSKDAANVGDGEHLSNEVAASRKMTTRDASSIRAQLIRKDIIFAPDTNVVDFRVPLMVDSVDALR
jgi:hypothetical protein